MKQNIVYEVFIHKVDGDMFMTDDQKVDCLNEIQNNMRNMLREVDIACTISFHLTSIYDHTIYEALSKVV
jgi:Ras-related GTP-binding protein C/D